MAHVTQLATRFQHWPAESDTGIANLPTLRLLRCIYTIPGLELLTLPKLRNTNEIAATIREASLILDQQRASTTEAPVLQNVSVPSSTTRARVSERSELPGTRGVCWGGGRRPSRIFLILRIKIKRFRLRIAYSYTVPVRVWTCGAVLKSEYE